MKLFHFIGLVSSECADFENDRDFVTCKEITEESLLSCIQNCDIADASCSSQCNRDFAEQLDQCPCQSGCPDGCPCPVYECPEAEKAVLVLNTSKFENYPVLIDSIGMNNVTFTMEENTQAYWSCSLKWRNKMLVFGGDSEKRQISEISNCGLRRIGDLAFDHDAGACTVDPDENIYLCFNYNTRDYRNQCRKADSPLADFSEIRSTFYDHKTTRIASSEDNILAIGHTMHTRAELFHFDTQTWSISSFYPFAGSITRAPVLYYQNAFYVIGGNDYVNNAEISIIAKLEFTQSPHVWSEGRFTCIKLLEVVYSAKFAEIS